MKNKTKYLFKELLISSALTNSAIFIVKLIREGFNYISKIESTI